MNIERGLRNYSIYIMGDLLFAYFEYVEKEFQADMGNMVALDKT